MHKRHMQVPYCRPQMRRPGIVEDHLHRGHSLETKPGLRAVAGRRPSRIRALLLAETTGSIRDNSAESPPSELRFRYLAELQELRPIWSSSLQAQRHWDGTCKCVFFGACLRKNAIPAFQNQKRKADLNAAGNERLRQIGSLDAPSKSHVPPNIRGLSAPHLRGVWF